MLWHPREQFRYPPGIESCLKKLFLEAGATGFQDQWKGGWSLWDPLGKKRYPEGSTGSIQICTRNRRRANKLIPD